MERFVPCRVIKTKNCLDCVFREAGLRGIKADHQEAMEASRYSFVIDEQKPLEKEPQSIINFCARITQVEFVPKIQGEFIITQMSMPPARDRRI